MQYRDYQAYAINELFGYFEKRPDGNPIVVMPTGTGKSIVIGGFIKEVLHRYPGQRIMKLTHVKELIAQNLNRMLDIWPEAPVGVFSAGLKRREILKPITFAGIASAVKRPKAFGHIDLVLIDECHLVSPKADTMYQSFLNALKETNPNLRTIGFTATHYRLGQGLLTEGGLFDDVCVDMSTMESFNWFIDQGYLCRLVPRPTTTELDIEDVKIQRGEYNLKQLQEAVDREDITKNALQETLALAADRKHWLVFSSGIDHAINITLMLLRMGIPATCVHSKMSGNERDKRIRGFLNGKYRAIVNNGILTTGFDFPAIDLIVMLRPTQSPGLWVQMLGRGTRADYAPGHDLTTTVGRLQAIATSAKKNCLVLDFAGNTKKLGPVNDPVIPKRKGKGGGEAPVKICDGCGVFCHASVRVCPECGFVFPRMVKIARTASNQDLIASSTPKVETFKVDRITYNSHYKQDRPTSLRVSYYCGLRMFEEWVCLEHTGYARKLAIDWWRQRSTDKAPPPETVADAFERLDALRTPSHIRVWVNKKYPEVLNYAYAPNQ